MEHQTSLVRAVQKRPVSWSCRNLTSVIRALVLCYFFPLIPTGLTQAPGPPCSLSRVSPWSPRDMGLWCQHPVVWGQGPGLSTGETGVLITLQTASWSQLCFSSGRRGAERPHRTHPREIGQSDSVAKSGPDAVTDQPSPRASQSPAPRSPRHHDQWSPPSITRPLPALGEPGL